MQNVDNSKKGGNMKLYPRNRHLIIEPIEEKPEEQTGILLPEDYTKPKPPFMQARVKELSPDCTVNVSKGDKIVIERSMLQEVEVSEGSFYLVLENYIYGVLSNR